MEGERPDRVSFGNSVQHQSVSSQALPTAHESTKSELNNTGVADTQSPADGGQAGAKAEEGVVVHSPTLDHLVKFVLL